MTKTTPLKFFQQVKAEVLKVTWAGRQEILVSSIMVFIMVALASAFFLVVDQLLAFGTGFLLGSS